MPKPSQIDELPYTYEELTLIKNLEWKAAADSYRARRVALGLFVEPPLGILS